MALPRAALPPQIPLVETDSGQELQLGPPALPTQSLVDSIDAQGEIAEGDVDEDQQDLDALKTPRIHPGGGTGGEVLKLIYSPKTTSSNARPAASSRTASPGTALGGVGVAVSPTSTSESEDDGDDDDEDWSDETSEEEGAGYDEEEGETDEYDEDEDEDESFREQDYEVDVGPLKDKIAAEGGGEVRMRAKHSGGDQWASELVSRDEPQVVTTNNGGSVPLEPYNHQVGGHSHIFKFSKKAVAKVSSKVPCSDVTTYAEFALFGSHSLSPHVRTSFTRLLSVTRPDYSLSSPNTLAYSMLPIDVFAALVILLVHPSRIATTIHPAWDLSNVEFFETSLAPRSSWTKRTRSLKLSLTATDISYLMAWSTTPKVCVGVDEPETKSAERVLEVIRRRQIQIQRKNLALELAVSCQVPILPLRPIRSAGAWVLEAR